MSCARLVATTLPLAIVALALTGCAGDTGDDGVKFEGGSSGGTSSGGDKKGLDWETYPGTVVDPKTNLMWQREHDGKKRTWEEARKYCTDLVLAKLDDWRLPHKDDLCTIFLMTGTTPAIDLQAFPNTPAAPFWTRTQKTPTTAWGVAFDKASALECQAGYEAFNRTHYVRCVR